MNAGKVDVLAVMDDASEQYEALSEQAAEQGLHDNAEHFQQRMEAVDEARAAVAELIEAAQEWDVAESDYHEKVNRAAPQSSCAIAWNRVTAARARLRAALARIGGGQ